MHDSTSIFNLILGSIFIGFGFVIPIVALLKTSDLKKLKFKELFILTAVQAVRVSGIIYFVLWLVQMYFLYSKHLEDPAEIYSFENRLFGPYWLIYWFPPLMYLLLSQLFWIKKLYLRKPALITLCVLLLVLPSQRFLIFITAFHRDYLPSSWSMCQSDLIVEFALNIIVFIFIIITIMLAGNKFKHIKQ